MVASAGDSEKREVVDFRDSSLLLVRSLDEKDPLEMIHKIIFVSILWEWSEPNRKPLSLVIERVTSLLMRIHPMFVIGFLVYIPLSLSYLKS